MHQETPSKDLYSYSLHTKPASVKAKKQWALDFIDSIYPTCKPYWSPMRVEWTQAVIDSYAEGRQDETQYKLKFNPQGDNKLITGGTQNGEVGDLVGLDWSVPSPMPKILHIIESKLQQTPVDKLCTAISPEAQNKRQQDALKLKVQKFIDADLAEMSYKIGLKAPVKSGIAEEVLKQPMEVDFDFDNAAELQIYMDTFYKQDVEQAAEQCLAAVDLINEADRVRKQWIRSATRYGVAAGRRFMDNVTCMPDLEAMDVFNLQIAPHKRPDAKDAAGWFYPYAMTVNDVIRYFGKEVTPEDIKKIFEKAAQSCNYSCPAIIGSGNGWRCDWSKIKPIDLDRVRLNCYYFEIKTTNTDVWEAKQTKKGGVKRKRKDYNYKPKDDTRTREEYHAEVVYKGYKVEDLPIIYGYGMLENMIRKEGEEQLCPFTLVLHEFAAKSVVEACIPYLDDLQLLVLKIRHSIQKSRPSGIAWDWDALKNLPNGNGGTFTWTQLVNMFNQTGDAVYRSMDDDGNPLRANSNAVFQRMENGIGKDVQGYLEAMAACLNLMEQEIGYNSVMTGSAPEARTPAKGIALAAAASDYATYYLIDGLREMVEDDATLTMALLQDMAKYGGKGWESMKAMVGKVNAAIVESMDDLSLHQMGIGCEPLMSDDELERFREALAKELGAGKITMSDYLMVYSIRNPKKAVAIFQMRARKLMQAQQQQAAQEMQFQQAMIDSQNQIKAQLGQLQSQTDLQGKAINADALLKAKQLDVQGKIASSDTQANAKIAATKLQGENDINYAKTEALNSFLTQTPQTA